MTGSPPHRVDAAAEGCQAAVADRFVVRREGREMTIVGRAVGRLALLAFLVSATQLAARTVTVTVQGQVVYGIDSTGVFGASNTSLSGQRYTSV